MVTLLILLVIVVVLAFWIVGIYNGLVTAPQQRVYPGFKLAGQPD